MTLTSRIYVLAFLSRLEIYAIMCWFCDQMNCPAAMERIREDKPITIRDDKGNTSRCIAEIVSVSCFS